MNCDKCGQELAEAPKKDPWCMYKLQNNEVISQLFDPDKIPSGWYDSPGEAKKIRRKPNKPKALNNGNSSGINQLGS